MIRRMRRTTRHRLISAGVLALTLALVTGALWFSAAQRHVDSDVSVPEEHVPAKRRAPALQAPATDPRDGLVLDPNAWELQDDHYVQRFEDGTVVRLTLDPALQAHVQRNLRKGRKVPRGAVVAIEPSTGRVLAMSSFEKHKAEKPLMIRADSPAASIFKIVTTAALLEVAQIDPTRPVCFSGGGSVITIDQVRGNPVLDSNCSDLAEAFGRSINPVFARLAYYHLTREDLDAVASRFGFNRQIPFELPVDLSVATFVDDDIERARTAAGFWNVSLSPLHAAMIAAAVHNEGIMMRPTLVDRIEWPDGSVYSTVSLPWLTAVNASHAKTISAFGELTTTTGTAAKAFANARGWPADLTVSGKTGTLAARRPYASYTWFAGAAPTDAPTIAVAALVINDLKWWRKGMDLAADTIREHHRLARKLLAQGDK